MESQGPMFDPESTCNILLYCPAGNETVAGPTTHGGRSVYGCASPSVLVSAVELGLFPYTAPIQRLDTPTHGRGFLYF